MIAIQRELFLLITLLGVLLGAAAAHAGEPLLLPAASAPIPAAYRLTVKNTEEVVSQGLGNAGAGHVAAFILGMRGAVLYESSKPLAAELRSLTFDKSTLRWTANLLIT